MMPDPRKKNRLILPAFLATIVIAVFLMRFGENSLRYALLYLSTAAWARSFVAALPLARQVARRFVAGETVGEAIAATRALNKQGMKATLDYLGESVSTLAEAREASDEILRLLEQIEREQLDATVSVKLSQLGLRLSPEITYENVRQIVASADEKNNRIRIDMEESAVVDITLDIYKRLRFEDGFDNVGIVVQSYLYRTAEDVAQLIETGESVRLCKGAYMEPDTVAYPEKEDTDASFVRLMRQMLGANARENGVYLGVATHDEKMIEATKVFAGDSGVSPRTFEFQMLYGIRRDLQEALLRQGYQVRVYVPYGTAWYPYFVRRLAERPANLWFFLSNLVRL